MGILGFLEVNEFIAIHTISVLFRVAKGRIMTRTSIIKH